MKPQQAPDRFKTFRNVFFIGLLALAVAGCASDPEHKRPTATRNTVSPVVGLLEYADTLATSDAATRETAVRQMRRAVSIRPDARNYARLSLALGTPHQRLYTPDEAARYARKAMAARDARWDRISRRFLALQAHQLTEISRRPRSEPAVAKTHDGATSDARVARLTQQLAEARAKIAALSNLERQLDSQEVGR